MFDGLFKSKFYGKCKSDMKLVKTRVEIIKNKRNAMQKYLRNDVADLLKSGLDINAYGRAEGLWVELNRTECYEFIEQCVVNVLNHLGVMNKQSECPEECRESVSTLMFAAARFADLPELRELRTIFSERYGNSLDFHVNKQFVEKLKSGLPAKDKKLRLLQDIAKESGIEWNSKALEKKLYNEATCKEDFVKETNDHMRTLPGRVNGSIQDKDSSRAKYQFKNARELAAPDRRHSYYEKKEASPIDDRFSKGSHQVLPVKEIQVIKKTEPISLRSDPNKEMHEDQSLKFKSIPPPYTVSKENKAKSSFRDNMNDFREKMTGPTESADSADDVKTKSIPKSVRRRNLRPPLSQENKQEKMADKNKEKVEQGQRILKFFDGGGYDKKDEEEIMMDKLLRHFSRKKDPNESIKPCQLLNTPTTDHARVDSSKAVKSRSKDGPNRSSSLPGELTSPTETPKGHIRTASFQPEMMNGNNVRVHPKLPDYDEFLARLEALRRKS